jgi:hypothetical protein
MAKFSKYLTSWKILLKMMTGNVVILMVYVLMYIVLSKAVKHAPYGELVRTREFVAL